MSEIQQTERASKQLTSAVEWCKQFRHEFVMPEHLLLALTEDNNFTWALNIFSSTDELINRLKDQLNKTERVPVDVEYQPETSVQLSKVLEIACQQVFYSSAQAVDTPHLVMGLLRLEDSWACYLLKDLLADNESEFMSQLINYCDFDINTLGSSDNMDDYDDDYEDDDYDDVI